MLCTKGATKTVVLKSPDSDKVREVIVTSVLLPKSENEIVRTLDKSLNSDRLSSGMEKRFSKRRLDHLSLEEKILRKKLKNREAAQTSRDKKKARLEELEASVVHLQNENDALHEEVRSLKDDKESLTRENARLTEEIWRLSVGGVASGPAVSCPPPQGVIPPPPLPHPPLRLLRVLALILSLSASRSTTGTGSTSCPSHLSLKNLRSSQIRSLRKLLVPMNQNPRKKEWWGRKQKAWNPVGHA